MPPFTGDPKQHDPSSFAADGMTGSCLCGSIRVTITAKDLFSKPRGHLCSCANCRKVAGSFVSSNMLLDASEVNIEDRDGTLKYFDDKATGSGNSVYRYFCSVDGKYVEIVPYRSHRRWQREVLAVLLTNFCFPVVQSSQRLPHTLASTS